MSLLDLRRRATRSKPAIKQSMTQSPSSAASSAAVSADDFIENATRYAHGLENVVPIHTEMANTLLTLVDNSQSPPQGFTKGRNNSADETQVKVANKPKQPYRRSTFTLSEQCIDTLNVEANNHHCAKSQLVRAMINYFSQLSTEDQQALIEQQKSCDH